MGKAKAHQPMRCFEETLPGKNKIKKGHQKERSSELQTKWPTFTVHFFLF